MSRHARPSEDRWLKHGLWLAGVAAFAVWVAALSPLRFLRPGHAHAANAAAGNVSFSKSHSLAKSEAPAPQKIEGDFQPAVFKQTGAAEQIANPQQLLAAVAEEDEARVEMLLKRGVNVNAVDETGCAALSIAAEKSNLALVKKLLAAGADANHADREGRTPLIAAAPAGDVLILKELLDRGANLDAADSTGHGAIHYAIEAQKLDSTRFLLARGADLTRACCEGKNAFAHAFETFDREMEKIVLSAQPSSLSWTAFTRDALFNSIRGRDREMTRLLLAKHSEPPTLEGARQPLLAYVIAWQDLDQLKFLLDCGANPTAPLAIPAEKKFVAYFKGEMIPHYLTEEPGMTPLMLAAAMGRADITRMLLEHGAKRGTLTAKYKLNAENFAAWANSAPTLLVLLGKNPDVDQQPMRVRISLSEQRAYLYKNDQIALTTRISTGKPGHATPTGDFVITDKHPSHRSTIYKVDMPFFMRLNCREFGMHEGIVPNYPASHGCIRMPGDKARELYKQVEIGTLVTIAN